MINKKALSPIITTILLVLLAIVLASIIYIWAKNFGTEQVAKFDAPIENACADVRLEAAITAEKSISIINQGSIPVNKVKLLIINNGNSQNEENTINLVAGGAKSITTTASLIGDKVTVTLVPVLLGTAKSDPSKIEEFPCTSSGITLA